MGEVSDLLDWNSSKAYSLVLFDARDFAPTTNKSSVGFTG
jgi:hypothetical protein